MCSQFKLTADLDSISKSLGISLSNNICENVSSLSQHVYPYTTSPVVISKLNEPSLELMNYSLIPNWSISRKPKWSTYNARLDRINGKTNKTEFIYDLPTWRDAFNSRHCLVPLSGFIESCSFGSHAGKLVEFSGVNYNLLFAAGIWDSWTDRQTGEIINSFAIITDDPIPYFMQVGHDRQPVFLAGEDCLKWLQASLTLQDGYIFLKNNQQKLEYQVKIIRATKTTIPQSDYDLFNSL